MSSTTVGGGGGGWDAAATSPPLSLAVGYAIVIGFGGIFALVTTLLVWLDDKYGGHPQGHKTSEHFNTAGRSVKTGMIAAVVCSQWTWAATLLQSSNVAWLYGVSGPFWYGSGACVQILLFGILSIEIKRKAPHAHTVCEIIRARWGNGAHKVFLSFCLLTNILVTAMLLLGGAATISTMTGMSVHVASFLIPLGIITYTFADGLAATFLSNYLHTVILHGVLVVFIVCVYLSPIGGGQLGSVREMYERLTALNLYTPEECLALGFDGAGGGGACGPVEGNREGSYLTMFSQGGMMFALINLVGNFGTVFTDQAYWQSAIAARPSAAVRGYLLGGLAWFAIPFTLATSLGLACLALQLPITHTQANAGLVPVASALELLGASGGVLMLLMVFMAVTSCGSAELIAVSSLLTYDIYHTYINPHASSAEILKVSRLCVCVFGLVMGGLAVALEVIGLDLGYMYLLTGVLVGAAVFPISTCLLWRKTTARAAIMGAIVGVIVAVCAWLLAAFYLSTGKGVKGTITLASTGQSLPMLIGNLSSILVSAAVTTVHAWVWPDDYDWTSTRALKGLEEKEEEIEQAVELGDEMNPQALTDAKKFVLKWGIAFTVLMLVLWPLLSLPAGAPFPLGYFELWVWVGIVWGFLSTAVITVLPLYESRREIAKVMRGMFGMGEDGKQQKGAGAVDDSMSSSVGSAGGGEEGEMKVVEA